MGNSKNHIDPSDLTKSGKKKDKLKHTFASYAEIETEKMNSHKKE
jgi:hypothetical protein